MRPQSEQGYLVLADISGYTSFLAKTELDHANEIVSELLETITKEFRSHLTVSKYEGDAVFAYVSTASLSRPETLLELIERTYVAFRNRLQSSHRRIMCTCKACNTMSSLDLKFFIHCGEYIRRKIGGTMDLLGNDVNLVHRLMKNSGTEKTGWRGYALFTHSVLEKVGLEADGLVEHSESYEHIGALTVYAINLQDRFAELTDKRRHTLDDKSTHYVITLPIKAPPSVVWEWLHDPTKRSITEEIDVQPVRRIGGRTKEGAVNHCGHGKEMVVEEIIEWKPFEYASLRSTTAFGTMHQTVELSDTNGETIVVNKMSFRFKIPLLRPFARLLMRILAKVLKIDAIMIRTKKEETEKDWRKRSALLLQEVDAEVQAKA